MKRTLLIFPIISIAAIAIAADPTPPDKYEVPIGEEGAGSGFVIRYGRSFLGVASLHQFEGKTPSKLEALSGDAILLDKTKVIKQKDVQVLPVKAPSPKLQFLTYNPDFALHEGDEVIILDPAGDVVPGTLTAKGMTSGSYKSSGGPRNLQAKAGKPFSAMGGSGGPILLKRTGAVIGVLLTADDGSKARVLGFETLCLPQGAPAQGGGQSRVTSSIKTNASASSKAAAEKLAQVFPSLYWYASDACLRETTRNGFGHPQKHDAFVNSNKAVIETIDDVESRVITRCAIRLRLYDPEVAEEYWVLELMREGNTWEPKTGYKYMNGKLAFDLFKDEYLAGIKIMGSMKPYLQKALTGYSEGKDFRAVFIKSRQFQVQDKPSNFSASQLVGRWRYVDAEHKLTTNITFRRDGTYVGSVEENGKTNSSFSGKWTLKAGILNYEYIASSDHRIPVGTKDQDKVIELTKDRYSIQNAVGLRETYVRIE